MVTSRFDRRRFMIGTYCLAEYARSEEHIHAMKEANVDFVCGVPASDRALMDRLHAQGMGAFATGVLPGWWGGHGENAGGLAEKVPVSSYEKARENFADHPAVWGLDMGDEPSALDFPHYGRLFEKVKQLFPGLVPYLNLYPSYGVLASCTQEQVKRQLGTDAYEQHIDRFVECVDSDYICYDYYMYSDTAEGAYRNLRVVADRCRTSGRDMWIVLQVNSNNPDKWISTEQLRHQAYTALAFGARVVNWACWTAGWWHNQVLDKKGQPTRQYDRLKAVNRELREMGQRCMKYRNVSAGFVGEGNDYGLFEKVRISGGRALAGHMACADGEALMVADCESGEAYELEFRVKEDVDILSVCENGHPVQLIHTENNGYRARIQPSSGLLVEVMRQKNE